MLFCRLHRSFWLELRSRFACPWTREVNKKTNYHPTYLTNIMLNVHIPLGQEQWTSPEHSQGTPSSRPQTGHLPTLKARSGNVFKYPLLKLIKTQHTLFIGLLLFDLPVNKVQPSLQLGDIGRQLVNGHLAQWDQCSHSFDEEYWRKGTNYETNNLKNKKQKNKQ